MGDIAGKCSSLELAALAGLVVIDTKEARAIQVEDPVLWVGPGADDDLIATIACRRSLQRQGVVDEAVVCLFVEAEGFKYSNGAANDNSAMPVAAGLRKSAHALC